MKEGLKQITEIEIATFGSGGVNKDTLQSLQNTFPEGLIVEKENGKIIGYLGWERHTHEKFPPYNHDVSKTHEPCGLQSYISIITIAEQYRNEGIGSKLLAKFENRAKKSHCHTAYCPVNKRHPYLDKGVSRFWEKNGYKKSGETGWGITEDKTVPSFIYKKLL